MKENQEPVEGEVTNVPAEDNVTETTEVNDTPTAEVVENTEVAEAAEVKEIIEEAPAKVVSALVVPVVEEEFDWDAYEKGDSLSASAKENLKNIYDNTLNAIKDKEVVEGTVISINKRSSGKRWL